jgi:PAS domain S-box-containing protein
MRAAPARRQDRPVTGWSRLFASAFEESRNGMLLADEGRSIVDVNRALLRLIGARREAVVGRHIWDVVDGGEPQVTPGEWAAALAAGHFTGHSELARPDGSVISVQWGAHTETVTGHRLVLFVVIGTSRWGRRFRRTLPHDKPPGELTERECEIVRLVALGASGREIAEELHISHETVRTHVRNAMTKLHARSRAHLVAKALGEGYVLL